MYETMEITDDRIKTFEREVELPDFELGNSKLGIGIIMVMAAFVGAWGALCLISGLANSSSVQTLGRGLVTAITGM